MDTTKIDIRGEDARAASIGSVNPATLARILCMTDGIGIHGGRAEADAVLLAMIEQHPGARFAYRKLQNLANDAGIRPDEADWPLATYAVHAELDQLLAMAEPGNWADPGFLLDPRGDDGVQVDRLSRIAHARHRHGDEQVTKQHLAWLTSAVENESANESRRRERRLRDWPFNAAGPMDGAHGPAYPMIVGALSTTEQRFRSEMARSLLSLRSQPDNLQAVHARLRRLLFDVGDRSLRMGGLVLAALAQVYAIHADMRGRSIPTLLGRPPGDAARHLSERATELIARSRHGTTHDANGREVLRLRLDSIALTAAAGLTEPTSKL